MTSLNLKKGQRPPPSCYLENSILSNLCIGRTGFGFIGKHLEILSQDLPDSRLLMSSWRDLALTERVLSASITSLARRMLCRVPTDFSDSSPTLGMAEVVSMNLVIILLKAEGHLVRLNPSKTLPVSFHQGLMLTPEYGNPWKLPLSKWCLVRHLKLAIHKCYTILKIASSPLHDELLTDRNSWYPSFISGILKCFIWLRHPVQERIFHS